MSQHHWRGLSECQSWGREREREREMNDTPQCLQIDRPSMAFREMSKGDPVEPPLREHESDDVSEFNDA